MFDQKLMFKVMLWSLGIAAFFGVAAVLTARFEVVGRVTATAFLTSASAGFLWQAAVRLEQNPLAIRMAQTGAGLFFLFALCGIWEIGAAGKVWGTSLVCLGCLTVAASGLAMQRQADYRFTGLIAAVASVVSGICWLIGIWNNLSDGKIIGTGFAVAGWSATAAVCLVGAGTSPARPWRWIGVAAAAAGWCLSEYAIYQDTFAEWVSDWLFIIGSVTVVVIHAVLCYASRSAPPRLTIRIVAVVFVILTALLCDVIVLQNIEGDRFVVRLTIASAILASTSTIATAFILQRHWKQSRRGDSGISSVSMTRIGSPFDFTTVRLECPQCRKLSSLPVGDSACPRCGLKFQIRVCTPC